MIRTWNESLKIGIPLLDCQHEQLLDQIDRLLLAIETDKSESELLSILSFLKMYVHTHFNYEESCMNLYQCPVACQNQKAHQKFLNTLADINQAVDEKQPFSPLARKIKQELLDWFVNHIKTIDIQLGISVTK